MFACSGIKPNIFMLLDSRMTRLGTFLGKNGCNRVKHLVDPKQTVVLWYALVCVETYANIVLLVSYAV